MTFRRLLLFVLLASSPAFAESKPLYKSTDQRGRVTYSDKVSNASEKLGEKAVKKINLDKEIQSLRAKTPNSCEGHGGQDCSAGADSDGSVICMSGFKEAEIPYNQACLETQLKIDTAKLSEDSKSVEILIRNLSSVEAQSVEIFGRLKGQKRHKATGPAKVEAYSLAEYIVQIPGLRELAPPLRVFSYSISCDNCPLTLNRAISLRQQ